MPTIELIFSHDRFDRRKLPNLMANRLGVGWIQVTATLSAVGGNTSNHLIALLRGNQFA